jgi:hypothetical protein
MAVTVDNLNGVSRVATGSRVRLQLKGQDVGYATIASYSETISYDAISVLDQLEIAEHVPVSYDVSFTASRVYLIQKSLKGLNYFPTFGAGSDEFLENVLLQGSMNADIIDRNAGPLVRLYGVRVTSHNLTFGARSVVGEDVAFVATRVADAGAENI